ncbi:hypothetical protein LINPERPRIM_LOCUS20029 [Linum perenne]
MICGLWCVHQRTKLRGSYHSSVFSFDGHTILLDRWIPMAGRSSVLADYDTVWITARGIPLHLRSTALFEKLGNWCGGFLGFEEGASVSEVRLKVKIWSSCPDEVPVVFEDVVYPIRFSVATLPKISIHGACSSFMRSWKAKGVARGESLRLKGTTSTLPEVFAEILPADQPSSSGGVFFSDDESVPVLGGHGPQGSEVHNEVRGSEDGISSFSPLCCDGEKVSSVWSAQTPFVGLKLTVTNELMVCPTMSSFDVNSWFLSHMGDGASLSPWGLSFDSRLLRPMFQEASDLGLTLGPNVTDGPGFNFFWTSDFNSPVKNAIRLAWKGPEVSVGSGWKGDHRSSLPETFLANSFVSCSPVCPSPVPLSPPSFLPDVSQARSSVDPEIDEDLFSDLLSASMEEVSGLLGLQSEGSFADGSREAVEVCKEMLLRRAIPSLPSSHAERELRKLGAVPEAVMPYLSSPRPKRKERCVFSSSPPHEL